MKASPHQGSWIAWILCSFASLALFGVFWFYLVFHRLLGLSVPQLVQPFVVLAILLVCFAAAAKVSREKFINRGNMAPMMIAVYTFFLSLSLWLVHYARAFGYLHSSAARLCYIGLPVIFGLLGLLSAPLMPWMAHTSRPIEFNGADDQERTHLKAL